MNASDAYQMKVQLRDGIVKKNPEVRLANDDECDEAYVIAGHKAQPEIDNDKKYKGRHRWLKGEGGRDAMKKTDRQCSR